METSHSHHLETHSDSYLVKIKPEIKLLSFFAIILSIAFLSLENNITAEQILHAQNIGYEVKIKRESRSLVSLLNSLYIYFDQNGDILFDDNYDQDSDGDYDVNDTGGSTDVTLSTSQLPSHTHGDGSLSASNVSLTGAINKISEGFGAYGSASGVFTKVSGGNNPITGSSSNSPVGSVTFDASHTHDVTGSTGSTGSGSSIENRPPYYALCYIMKT